MLYTMTGMYLDGDQIYYYVKDINGQISRFSLGDIQRLMEAHTFTNVQLREDGSFDAENLNLHGAYQEPGQNRFIEVYRGESLVRYIDRQKVTRYRPRYVVDQILDYVHGERPYELDRLMAISGLRRTGKTMSLLQTIHRMIEQGISPEEICYINIIGPNMDSFHLYDILDRLDCPHIFVDEITFLSNFVNTAAKLYSYVSGCRIVIAGTESFTFPIALHSTLLGRAYLINTTFVSYREYIYLFDQPDESVEYLQYGGVLTNELDRGVKIYTDEMLAANIYNTLHRNTLSLEAYGYGALTRASAESIIYYVIYLLTCVTDTIGKRNREIRMDDPDIISIVQRVYEGTEIRAEKELGRAMLRALEELGILQRIRNLTPEIKGLVVQTSSEYTCSVQSLIYTLLSVRYDNRVDKSDVLGKAMENLVIAECFEYCRQKEATVGYFKYQFEGKEHEIDAVIRYENKLEYSYTLIEIKHSDTPRSKFARHLTSKSLAPLAKFIKHRYVIYLGETQKIRDVHYIYYLDFLSDLGKWI